ncbi:solute carrier family 52, riboflavin transporter, member 3-A-like [Lytechinus variegatus]|uniref:solute carrier family 52, riboflavin transporter, member 3-A-like n=1 Tax=Lytechinus variegatus TaxID=7654 RepID=UPI001BB2545E|nr:solute carrier family 52, riboflavin transporter, member 3-A-like [Lytechinus variegatus]XP_041454575.1 solute carrier family 52, riboflavin transporter, member 3-A-like [Lytechinus variegatus]
MNERLGDRFRHIFVIILVVLFGSGSWLAINGLWVELPLMVALGIPEGYNLASYLVIIIQLANVGPLSFTAFSYFVKGNKLEIPTIYLSLSAGVLACLLLVFFWDATTVWGVFGEPRSTALICLSFVLALVNCTSSVTFIPFMVKLKSSYMTWFFVGQGFSALAPSLVALGQGVGKQVCVANYTYLSTGDNCTSWMSQTQPAKFAPETFFSFLCASMFLSFAAFLFLHILPSSKKEYAQQTTETQSSSEKYNESRSSETEFNKEDSTEKQKASDRLEEETSEQRQGYSKGEYAILFVILAITNALSNSVLPSIQSFSCGAYGFNAYLLAATLGQVANPLACFIVMFFPQTSLVLVAGTCLLGLLMGGYCMATALLSPAPPLQGEISGVVLVVIAWILAGGLFAHVKATIGFILRNQPQNHRLLTWYGIVTQLGSMTGALIIFPFVNVLSVFVPYYSDPCQGYPICEPS